jgi:hypothetical protein
MGPYMRPRESLGTADGYFVTQQIIGVGAPKLPKTLSLFLD